MAGLGSVKVDITLRVTEEYKSLVRELDENKKDAARYRWLRKQHWTEGSMCVVVSPKAHVGLGAMCPTEDRLDKMIDNHLPDSQQGEGGEDH